MNRWLGRALTLLLGVTMFNQADAQVSCRDSGLITRGKLLTDLCWTCIFPLRIMGIPLLGSPNNTPDLLSPGICVCPSRMFPAVPAPGISFGMWLPSHVHEVTRKPFCSPLLGISLADFLGPAIGLTRTMHGAGQGHNGGDVGQASNYFWHWVKLPTGAIWDLFAATACTDKFPDVDIGYMSEFDPTMWDDVLAMYTHPEASIFEPVWAEAACIADGVVSTLRKPMPGLFFCAGTWGRMYPFTPRHDTNETIEGHMLVATRGLAAMHRRALAHLTTGPIGICGFAPWFVIPKQQYKFQNLWPFPQRGQAQWIGASSWRFGTFRKTPAHEDRVLTQFTFRECCITFF